jgi:multiple sugar transport system substrate-binding protein
MILKMLSLTVKTALVAVPLLSFAATEVVVQYPYPELFEETHKQLKEAFLKVRPDITLVYRAPYASYEEGTQKILREAVTNQLPDVTFQGLNRLRVLVDRKIAVPLDAFIAAEKNFDQQGFHKAMFDIGTSQGKVYGLPFAISLPISYYNLDLVKKAGGDAANLPTTWPEVLALAKKIKALEGGQHGVTYSWDITGNWLWQAPVFSQGGTMLNADESKVAFNSDAGKFAINMIASLVNEGGMPNLAQPDARSAFVAGKTGIHFTSTSDLTKITQMIGSKFELKTQVYPSVLPNGNLPAGGNLVVIVAKTPEKQSASWAFVKFATGPEGAAIMAKTTGYIPPNKIANDVYLKDFYVQNPNHFTAVKQLPFLTGWYAFPGENGLKITDVINDHLQSIVSGTRAKEPQKVLDDMTASVQKLLPRQ